MLKIVKRACAAALISIFTLAGILPQAFAQILPPILPPLPGGSLIVAITSPAPGSPVSGTVPVSASVSIVGSLTVSRVQFYSDGNFIGSDSSAPYSVSWNTTSTNNGSHTLTAVATDILGIQWNSDPVTVTVSNGPPPDTTPPSVPTGLTANAVSSSQINLSWAASSDNVGVRGYRVYRDGAQIATTSTTFFANTGLSPSTTYSYAVAAFDAAGNLSARSGPASATTPAAPDTTPPSVPTGLTASAVSSSQINLSWAASSDNVGVSGYRVYRDGAQIATTSTTFFANTGLSPSTTYSYAVAAFDAAGNLSARSSPASATTPASAPDTTPPSVPTGLTASAVSSSQINLSWAASSDNVGVSGYRVYRDGTQIATTSTTFFSNTGLSPSTTYSYAVAAFDAAGNLSAQSGPASATTLAAADTTPPTVSITAPINGATIKGTVTVSANASDNVGVVGVQFFGDDGKALAPEVTTAPYSISVDTTTTNDGPHTLTAVARDAAGNRTTSDPVTVTVANNAPPPPPPPPGGTTRFEETDPSVAYSAGWAPEGSLSWSGGTATISSTAGAQATFTFSGPSVTWIAARGPSTGIARISLDGVFVTEVDTFSKTVEVRVPMFEATGLANTRHTLTIEVTGRQNAAATGAFVFVDAFDVPAATVSRLQETDPSIAYSTGSVAAPDWMPFDASRAWSAGLATLSKVVGAKASITFDGTGISWIGARGPQTGIARVTLDGVAVPPIDTYSATEQIQAEIFTKQGMADTTHTLTIEVTGEQNAASTSPLIIVDGFEVTMSGTRHQDTDPAIAYGPNWIQNNRDKAYSEGAAAESNTVGAQATITFSGTGIRWIGARGPQTGIARIFLDGAFVEDFDTYAQTEGPQHTDFFRGGLAPGTHTLSIQVIGKNSLSTDFWILIDAFDVIP